MARQPRKDHEGAVHHVYNRGNDRLPIYVDDDDYELFLRKACEFASEFGTELLAYCLMPNHYHLILRTGGISLSRYMHRLLTAYAVSFNDRWQKVGHPFQGRFKNRLCRDDNDLRGLVRYVHLNPVEAGLTPLVDDWKWSSHRAMVGLPGRPGDTALLLGLFDDDIAAYRQFLAQRTASRPELDAVAAESGVRPGMTRPEIESRRQFAWTALSCGYRRSDIARFLGVTRGAVTQLLGDSKAKH